MNLNTRTLLWIVVLALLPLMACEDEWTTTPEGFVEIEQAPFEYKAVSPDGSVIAIRHRPNEEKGDLDYWAEVFELELVDAKGYRLAEKSDVKSADGVLGRLLSFELAQGTIPFHYGLAIYVTDESIVTLETATELASLERYAEAFDEARKGLNARAGD